MILVGAYLWAHLMVHVGWANGHDGLRAELPALLAVWVWLLWCMALTLV